MNNVNSIICGSAKEVLKTLPADSINCCISSPPYLALRDYGWDTCTLFGSLDDFAMPKSRKKRDRWWIMIRVRAHRRGGVFSPNKKTWIGALGLEPTFELYIDHLCGIYDEVKRVLRPDGTCWVNLGDTYNAGRTGGWAGGKHGMSKPENSPNQSGVNAKNLPAKSLCLIPDRFRIEMINRGWILRNKIIWHKLNPMPSSAKDRFTVDFEEVMFFTKSKRYFFEPIYEDVTGNAHPRGNGVNPKARIGTGVGWGNQSGKRIKQNPSFSAAVRGLVLGRNKRTVWTIPTQAFSEAHFATFPEKLVEPMILAGCPKEVCSKCGQGRRKVYEHKNMEIKRTNWGELAGNRTASSGQMLSPPEHHFKGYTDCGCGAEWTPGVVLDPFWAVARPVRWPRNSEGTGSESNSNRNISKWQSAA